MSKNDSDPERPAVGDMAIVENTTSNTVQLWPDSMWGAESSRDETRYFYMDTIPSGSLVVILDVQLDDAEMPIAYRVLTDGGLGIIICDWMWTSLRKLNP